MQKSVSATPKTVRRANSKQVGHGTRSFYGLRNVANNCWFNATVQAISHTSFGQWLKGKVVMFTVLLLTGDQV